MQPGVLHLWVSGYRGRVYAQHVLESGLSIGLLCSQVWVRLSEESELLSVCGIKLEEQLWINSSLDSSLARLCRSSSQCHLSVFTMEEGNPGLPDLRDIETKLGLKVPDGLIRSLYAGKPQERSSLCALSANSADLQRLQSKMLFLRQEMVSFYFYIMINKHLLMNCPCS